MRSVAVLLATVAALVLSPATARALSPGEDRDESTRVDRYLADHRDAVDSPGLAYAVIRGDQVVHEKTIGTDGDGEPMTEHTPFLLGSIAKPFTATAVMQLVESGDIDLDAPVLETLPWFRLAGNAATGRITARHLLTHTSGISEAAGIRLADRFDNSRDGLAESVRDLADVEPVSAPGTTPEYSSANYMVLGAMVEEVTGASFGDYLRRQVLTPLQMRDAIVDADAAEDRLPPGHRRVFGRTMSFDSAYDTSGLPYGYLAASLEDLTHFAIAGLVGGRYDGSRILPEVRVEAMQTGQVDAGSSSYGLGWKTMESDGHRTVFHSGATAGYMSTVLLVPDEDLAVVVMHNYYRLADDARLHEAAFNVARILRGHEPRRVEPDPLLTYAPWAILAVAVVLVGFLVRSAVRSRHQLPRHRSGLLWIGGAIVLAVTVGWVLPANLGAGLSRMLLWTPDIGYAILAVLVACALAVLVHGTILLRSRRNRDASAS